MSSGQLELHGRIENWQRVQALLFTENAPAVDHEDTSEDWGADWGWKEEENTSTGGDDPKHGKNAGVDESWLRDCVMANSPMAELFVLAKGRRAVFFSSEWDTKNNEMKYTKSYEGIVSQEEEEVTCAICMPLVSKKKTSPGVPDWSCVILGFDDGQIKMYTENGSLLISQMFHNQPVKAIKCRSYQPALTAMKHDQLEEVFVLYQTVIVTLDGFGLFQTLRGCRSHIARLQANAAEQMVDPPPLSYKKWEYEECRVSDCDSIGLETPTPFDHMLTASIMGGQSAKCSKSPITSSIFVACGERPYAAFMYGQEGQSEPLISEFAFAVASRLKNSFFNMAGGMFGFGSPAKPTTPSTKPKPKIEPATQMQSRFGLPDKQRKGRTIIVSPCKKLSAVTDSLGRVILVDNEIGIAVRIFKGYRDAQCAWVEVTDSMSSRSRTNERKALFLVIYAPRRGFLEVFAMQQGPKVASFPVTKHGRLLSTTHGMMGLNNIPIKGGNNPSLPCIFIDQDAQMYSLNIPFHLALSDNGNSKIKDMHLLKSFQRLLREDDVEVKSLMEILSEVKTQAMINQGFKMLIQKCKQVNVLIGTVDEYLRKYCDDGERDLSVAFRVQTLLDLYTSLTKSMDLPPSYCPSSADANENSSYEQTILKCLHATAKEVKSLQDMADRADTDKQLTSHKSVTFQDSSTNLSITDYFSCFLLEFEVSKRSTSALGKSGVKLNMKSESITSLGKLLFCGCLNNDSILTEWKSRVKNAGLIPSELLSLCLKFWCDNALASSSYVTLMEKMYNVIKGLSDLEGKDLVFNDHSRVSGWWENIRKEITGCPKIFHVYSFALVCRAVAVDIQQEIELESLKKGKDEKSISEKPKVKNTDVQEGDEVSSDPQPSNSMMEVEENIHVSDVDEEDWENVSLELIRWNFLVKQIEDLSLLTMIITRRPKLDNPTLPVLTLEVQQLAVIDLLDKGKGCIAELVGKWLTSIGVDPKLLEDESEVIKKEFVPEPEVGDKKPKKSKVDSQEKIPVTQEDTCSISGAIEALQLDKDLSSVLDMMTVLKENFSVSLSSSIILSNYCWEYCLEWNKDPDRVVYFSAAVSCAAAIPCPFIRHGMLYMTWNTFIKKRLAAIVSTGRVVKDRLVEKVSGFSGNDLKEKFLKTCVTFLDEYMATTVFCEGIGPPPVTPTKKTHWATDASSASLTDLALLQPHSNYEMILLHYQLVLASHFVYAFGIRKNSMKPMNLFDTKARMMFFSVMSSPAPYSNVEVDLALKMLREEFLCLVITNAVHAIPEELGNKDSEDDDIMIVPSLQGVAECQDWIQKCFELARTWGLELDNLRINTVCEYYSSGLDYLGLENIGSVSSRDVIGSKLLVIAGMRVNYIIQAKRDSVTEIISSLSTNLTNWLNNLNYSQLRCLRFSKLSVTDLARQIIQLIPESSYDYKLAEELLRSSNFL